MPTPSWDDLDQFLQIDDFSVNAVRDGDNVPFPVILEEQVMSRELGTYDLAEAAPWIVTQEKFIRGMKKRDRLTIERVVYWLVHDPHPDGTGMATLQLSRVAPQEGQHEYTDF